MYSAADNYGPCLTIPCAKRSCLPKSNGGGLGGGLGGDLGSTAVYECNLMYPSGGKALPNSHFTAAFGPYIDDAPPATMTTATDYVTDAAHKKFLVQMAQHINWAYLVTKNKCNCQAVFGTSVWPPMADITKDKMVLRNLQKQVSVLPTVALEDIGIAYASDDATLYVAFRGAESTAEGIASAFSAKQAPFELWFDGAKEPQNFMSAQLVSRAFQDMYNANYPSNHTANKGKMASDIATYVKKFPNVTKVIISGHSVGCANSNFLHFHMTLFPDRFFATPANVQVFTTTFGAPRVVHPAFVSTWKNVTSTLASHLLMPVINLNDPIPNIPIPANPVTLPFVNVYTYSHMRPQLLGLRAGNPLLESHHTNAYTQMIQQGVTLLDYASETWVNVPEMPNGACP